VDQSVLVRRSSPLPLSPQRQAQLTLMQQ
jgi:hypothetical protein